MLVTQQEEVRVMLEALADKHGRDRGALIPILQEVQRRRSASRRYAMQVIADLLDIHPVEVYSVVSFYSFLDEQPQGQVRDPPLPDDHLRHGGQGPTSPGSWRTTWASTSARPRPTASSRSAGRTAWGCATRGRRCWSTSRSSPRSRRKRSTASSTSAGRRSAPTPSQTRKERVDDDRRHQNRHAHLRHDRARSRPDSGLGQEPPATSSARSRHSGLRGRGGAGFPTSLKWELAAAADGDGEVRRLQRRRRRAGHLQGPRDPRRVRRPGVRGHDHRRASHRRRAWDRLPARRVHLPPRRTWKPCSQAPREQGLLGKNIGGQEGFDFDIEIRMGSGAYVCGEETALIESLEGHRGEPRNRPAVPHRHRLPGQAHDRQQRRDLRLGRLHPGQGRRVVQGHRHRESTGHKLFSVSGDCATARRVRVPDGHHRGRAAEGSGRRGGQGGAGRRRLGPVRARRRISTAPSPSRTSPPAARSSSSARSATCSTWPRTSWSSSSTSRAASARPAARASPKLLEGVELLAAGALLDGLPQELCALGETMQLASKCGLGQSGPNAFLSIVDQFPDEILGRGDAGSLRGQGVDDGIKNPSCRHQPRTASASRTRSCTPSSADAGQADRGHHRRQSGSQVPLGRRSSRPPRRLGIRIPTLCYHEDLCLAGVCRICVVEVEGPADAAGRVQLPDHHADQRQHAHAARSARRGATSSTCCWPTTTASATPAPATTTASCRRWPRNTASTSSASAIPEKPRYEVDARATPSSAT